jgi:hypothetical protein
MRKQILGSVGILAILVFGFSYINATRTLRTRANSVNDSSSLSLKERAQQAGGKLIISDTSQQSIIYNDLNGLAKASTAVIVCATKSNRCRLSSNGQYVTTDYQVLVNEVLKGSMRAGNIITASTPGGLKVFDRSTSMLIQVPDFRRPINGRTYLFFLNQSGENSMLALTGGPQGAFELPGNGKGVRPSDLRPDHPLVRKYKNKDVKEFLKEVRQAVK